MLIDWFTVGAQTLNFLILVWLLRRFLYRPILAAIAAREAAIAAELASAAAMASEAEVERDAFQRKKEDLDRRTADLLVEAKTSAGAERRRLLEEARRAADDESTKRRAAMAEESRDIGSALRMRAGAEVVAIARKALAELSSTTLEAGVTTVFLRRLRELEGPAKVTMADAIRSASGAVVLRTAFELPTEQRGAIQEALNRSFSVAVQPRFEVAPQLACGIDLSAHGHRVGWSIAGYLDDLEKGIAELVGQRAGAPRLAARGAADTPSVPPEQASPPSKTPLAAKVP